MNEQLGTLEWCLRLLFHKGLRYSTVIDLGCADGHFYLHYLCQGIFAGARGVNVDASPLYEPSLRAIQEVTGAHYVIAAASDSEGEAELTGGAHPYWSSLRPKDDIYWEKLNGLSSGKIRVPTITVDGLRRQLNLTPPFMIKLDVQGAEAAALRGARETLAETDVVACEADLHDLRAIDKIMDEAGFDLFDLTDMRRSADTSLAWLYPVYLNRRRNALRRQSFWDTQANEKILSDQKERRQAILASNVAMLQWLKTQPRR